MRLTPQLLPLLLLLILPVLQCLGHITSLLGITFFLICTFFLRTALLFLKLGKRQKDKRVGGCKPCMLTIFLQLILESISISHYVEKVRWCLDFLDLPYTEEENVGILGILTLGRSASSPSSPFHPGQDCAPAEGAPGSPHHWQLLRHPALPPW